MTPRRTQPAAALVLAASALLAACGGSDGGPAPETKLTVLAASSLTEPFTDLAERFERDHDGVRVATSFGSSATIAAQVVAGAPADVLATADPTTMEILVEADLVAGTPSTFAQNRLALVVPTGNPAQIGDVSDLQDSAFVVCVPSAPCGFLAESLLREVGVTNPPVSREADDKAVLTKVALDEADAGLVYASDVVTARGEVEEVPLPPEASAATSYPAAVVARSDHQELAEEWIDLLLSAEGQQALVDAGFMPASPEGP